MRLPGQSWSNCENVACGHHRQERVDRRGHDRTGQDDQDDQVDDDVHHDQGRHEGRVDGDVDGRIPKPCCGIDKVAGIRC